MYIYLWLDRRICVYSIVWLCVESVCVEEVRVGRMEGVILE